MEDVVGKIAQARKKGVPLLAVESLDAAATVRTLSPVHEGPAPGTEATVQPLLVWDCVRGAQARNQPGAAIVAILNPAAAGEMGSEPDPMAQAAATDINFVLGQVAQLPEWSTLIVLNAHKFWDQVPVIQALLNLRDLLKKNHRTIILLAPALDSLPVELRHDVVSFTEALPTDDQLQGVVKTAYRAARLDEPGDQDLALQVPALRGLSAFEAEQIAALSLERQGINQEALWERWTHSIEQVHGLSVPRAAVTLQQVCGMPQLKRRAERIFGGENPPELVVWIDELEKHIAGAGGGRSQAGDSSGTSTDQVGVLLREMTENGWSGIIALGHPGSGKSFFACSLGPSFGRKTAALDLGAAKDKWVGSSEQNIRAIMKTLKGIAGRRVLFVATCNRIEAIPTELRRRFRKGIYFFDLPTRPEKDEMWRLYTADLPVQPLPNDEGWQGANIADCAGIARDERCTLIEAAESVIPLTISDPEGVAALRRLANGRFLSTVHPGPYTLADSRENARPETARGVVLDD